MDKTNSSNATDGGGSRPPGAEKRMTGFKIRKWPMFFACLAIFSFIATLGLSFMVASSYSAFFWTPFVSMSVFIASVVSFRASVVRHTLVQRALRRKKQQADVEHPEAEATGNEASQEVFDAQDVDAASPFTIDQLREVALSVAAESNDIAENFEWTPTDLPKPLYATSPKAQRPAVEALEKVDYKSEATIKQTVMKMKEAKHPAAEDLEPEDNDSAAEKIESAEVTGERRKECAEEPRTNLDDVLQRRRAF